MFRPAEHYLLVIGAQNQNGWGCRPQGTGEWTEKGFDVLTTQPEDCSSPTENL